MSAHSDSDDDPDYVSAGRHDPESDSANGSHPHESETGHLTQVEEDTKKKARDQLWADFKASSTSIQPELAAHQLVKIEKRYRFAAQDIVEVVEVSDASEDAKKWPRHTPQHTQPSDGTPTLVSNDLHPVASTSTSATSSTVEGTDKNKPRRPGPRKSKIALPPLPASSSQKAKKLTTLDKSAMDWRVHISQSEDTDLKDQLDANRKSGGYLEKVDFLQRVEKRKDEILDANNSKRKRRK